MFADAQGAKMYCRMAYMHKKTLLQVEGEFFILWIYEWDGVLAWFPLSRRHDIHCPKGAP